MFPRIPVPRGVDRLFDEQAGAASVRQIESLGLGRTQIARLVRDGTWVRSASGVCIRAASAPTFDRLLWTGFLVAGAPAAIGGLAALHRLGVAPDPPQSVTVFVPAAPKRRLSPPFIPVRDGRDRLSHARGSLPVIRIEDALLDESVRQSLEAFVGNVTDATRLRLTTPQRIDDVLRTRERLRHKAELHEVLTDLQGIESNLEYVFRRDVERAHGLPDGIRQYKAGRSRFDILYDGYGVVAEVDGERGHVRGRFRDYARDNEHAADLVTTFRYGTYDIRQVPCLLGAQLGRALMLRGWEGPLLACRRCRS